MTSLMFRPCRCSALSPSEGNRQLNHVSPFLVEGDKGGRPAPARFTLAGDPERENRQLRRANEILHPLALVLVTALNVELATTR